MKELAIQLFRDDFREIGFARSGRSGEQEYADGAAALREGHASAYLLRKVLTDAVLADDSRLERCGKAGCIDDECFLLILLRGFFDELLIGQAIENVHGHESREPGGVIVRVLPDGND